MNPKAYSAALVFAAVVMSPAVHAGYTCQGKTATIVGTLGNDVIYGTSANDVIVGLGGNDVIDGKGGNDTICGNEGADRLYGGLGNDRLSGGNGSDRLFGGPGADSIHGDTLCLRRPAPSCVRHGSVRLFATHYAMAPTMTRRRVGMPSVLSPPAIEPQIPTKQPALRLRGGRRTSLRCRFASCAPSWIRAHSALSLNNPG